MTLQLIFSSAFTQHNLLVHMYLYAYSCMHMYSYICISTHTHTPPILFSFMWKSLTNPHNNNSNQHDLIWIQSSVLYLISFNLHNWWFRQGRICLQDRKPRFPLGLEEKGMATHSSIFAWEILWKEEPGGLQSMGLQRVRRD